MGDGWSVQRQDLIASDEPTTHPDPRMHLKVGHGPYSKADRERHPELYLSPYPVTHRDPRLPPELCS